MKKIYLTRHCVAEGQASEASLTEEGLQQAETLAGFISLITVDRIISSPFKRATQSISPFSQKKRIPIEMDDRLTERVLGNPDLTDWLEKLEASFMDRKLRYEGGESSQDATNRIVGALEEIRQGEAETTVIVTHGNLLSLALNYYSGNFGFSNWKELSNPDIYLLYFDDDHIAIERVWDSYE